MAMTVLPNDNDELAYSQSERAFTLWQAYLTGDHSRLDAQVKTVQKLFNRLPSTTRCRV